jgi:hypothetical protein
VGVFVLSCCVSGACPCLGRWSLTGGCGAPIHDIHMSCGVRDRNSRSILQSRLLEVLCHVHFVRAGPQGAFSFGHGSCVSVQAPTVRAATAAATGCGVWRRTGPIRRRGCSNSAHIHTPEPVLWRHASGGACVRRSGPALPQSRSGGFATACGSSRLGRAGT